MSAVKVSEAAALACVSDDTIRRWHGFVEDSPNPGGADREVVVALKFIAIHPPVIRLPTNAVITAGGRDVAADFLDMAQDREPVFCDSLELNSTEAEMAFVMESSVQKAAPTVT